MIYQGRIVHYIRMNFAKQIFRIPCKKKKHSTSIYELDSTFGYLLCQLKFIVKSQLKLIIKTFYDIPRTNRTLYEYELCETDSVTYLFTMWTGEMVVTKTNVQVMRNMKVVQLDRSSKTSACKTSVIMLIEVWNNQSANWTSQSFASHGSFCFYMLRSLEALRDMSVYISLFIVFAQ